MRKEFYVASVFILVAQAALGYHYHWVYYSYLLTIPLFFMGLYDIFQTKRTLLTNYPLFGRARYLMEELRPKIYQYFIESDIDGAPINRTIRSVVYQRAKKDLATSPFGTQLDVYKTGYEWVNHSMNPVDLKSIDHDLRIEIGNSQCSKKYSCSRLNISAMSYGSLSKNAILALNKGAKAGNFAHNTGEGSISPYHLEHGGDLIWQIGTGYFGCRDMEGNFSDEKFTEYACKENVKMIEIKLSQGAKPGHGGILPSHKNNKEIAAIRGVKPFTTVNSPSYHKEFSDHASLLKFIQKLRTLSSGKPIGFKICLGHRSEFTQLCYQMTLEKVYPDFITIDGGEGGTGAAPLEFSNSIGTPLLDALSFISNELARHNLRNEIKIIAAGKIFTGFDMARAIALGADVCYSARGMMLALGCIQALLCNTNKCPVGVATQDPSLVKGLRVENKAERVFNFHRETLHSLAEIIAAAGFTNPCDLKREHIYRRISVTEVKSYEEIYPYSA